eukprot:TRINITY_DN17800_c0_g1_i2.p1 TRINITY_DN17800_c0_g1~~TRINITY_DN17800_c0_g1_i2.p1  ORF type:complete len:958 (+),score=131.92 TRINITY_DN17800_c0_g1_i2:415-2874(+)
MVQRGYLRLDDEIHYQSDNNICVVVEETGADGTTTHVLMDENSGNKYATLNLWVVGEFKSKANNSGKVSFRVREGTRVAMLEVGQAMHREINGEDSCDSSDSESIDQPTLKRQKNGEDQIKVKHPDCGVCKKPCHVKSSIPCSVPIGLRSRSCGVSGHPECFGLKSKAQISKQHIFACQSCFVPYITSREQENLLRYIASNVEAFYSLSTGTDKGYKAILPELLGKGTKSTFFVDPKNGKPLADSPAGVSHYSYKPKNPDHKKWFKELLSTSKLRGFQPQSAKQSTSNQTKQTVQPNVSKASVEIIDLDLDDVDEESINANAMKLANSFLANKAPVQHLSPLRVQTIRQFSGHSSSLYGKSHHFKPPPSNEVDFFDCLSSGRDSVRWSIYLQGSPSDLQIVFWPGVQQYARAIPLSDVTEFLGAFDDEDVYLHLTLQRDMTFVREVTRSMMKKKLTLEPPPANKNVKVPSITSARITKPVHFALMCHAALTGGDQTGERTKAKAIMSTLDNLINKKKDTHSKVIGEEVCWMRTTSVDLLGMSQKILEYAPQTTMDKGYLILDDYNRLRANRFLNGDCINFYLRHMSQHCKSTMFFSTHFMTKLIPIFANSPSTDRGSATLDWCSRGDIFIPKKNQQLQDSIFSYSLLIVPINDPSRHWGLGAVLNLDKITKGVRPTYIYLDSLLKPDKMRFTEIMPRFVLCRAKAEHQLAEQGLLNGKPVDMPNLRELLMDVKGRSIPKVPKQLNLVDCGVHVLRMAELLIENPTVSISESWFNPKNDITTMRQRIKKTIQKMVENVPNILKQLQDLDKQHEASCKQQR